MANSPRARLRRSWVSVLAAMTVAAPAVSAVAAPHPAHKPHKATVGVSNKVLDRAATYSPTDNFTATWKRADALKVQEDPTTTKPVIPENFPIMTDKVWIWDTWPLTDMHTNPITYKGWHVIFSLTAPRSTPFGDRHWVARIGYFFSRDGSSWVYGGHLFPDGTSLGSREWAGTAQLVSGNKVNAFYTASGHDNGGVNPNDPLQRLAMASGRIHADSKGVYFTGFRNHRIIAEPDGVMYQTLEQSQAGPIIYAFRDPFVFTNPADGKVYALFEGNTGGEAGNYQCQPRDLGPLPPGSTVPEQSRFYTGNIGLMEATNAKLTKWKLLPPLLSANCTNQQTERPHLVIHDGKYYLFTISHQFTYAPGLEHKPDGLYGFVGNALRSDYKPLNGSALVLGNPWEAPTQSYSDEVLPNLMVQSFIDTVPTHDGGVKFGGTLAPTLQIEVDGSNTYLTHQLGYGYIPATAAAD
jgi:levansucrase